MERTVINPWTWQDDFAFVQANAVSPPRRILICSGQTSVDADGKPAHAGDMAAQLTQALDNLDAVLTAAHFKLSDVVRLNYYTTDVDALFSAYDVAVKRLSDAGCRPASTLLGVSRLAERELMVEIEATAMV